MSDYQHLLVSTRGRVGIVSLNRPERLNALNSLMMTEMRTALEELSASDGIGAIVVTGEGRAFCSGADIANWEAGIASGQFAEEAAAGRVTPSQDEEWVHFLHRLKPIVAAFNGPAVGGGISLFVPTDLRIASERAKFAFNFVKVGLVPAVAGTRFLGAIVGLGTAMDLMLTCRTIDANEAYRIGLVSKVVPHHQLLDEAVATAATIAAHPTESLVKAKTMLWDHLFASSLDDVLQTEMNEVAVLRSRPAFAEAARAFREKREPNYHG